MKNSTKYMKLAEDENPLYYSSVLIPYKKAQMMFWKCLKNLFSVAEFFSLSTLTVFGQLCV